MSAESTLDTLLAQGLIRLVRHPMNFLDEISPTRYWSRAAAASAAASDAGMFHEYARVLFEDQPPEGGPGLSDGQLIELGEGIGISDPQFAATIRRGTYLPWPSFVTQRAIARGVAGTPSVFVDGIPVPARPGPIVAAVERVFP
jgi:protein-disulfide isomerase